MRLCPPSVTNLWTSMRNPPHLQIHQSCRNFFFFFFFSPWIWSKVVSHQTAAWEWLPPQMFFPHWTEMKRCIVPSQSCQGMLEGRELSRGQRLSAAAHSLLDKYDTRRHEEDCRPDQISRGSIERRLCMFSFVLVGGVSVKLESGS